MRLDALVGGHRLGAVGRDSLSLAPAPELLEVRRDQRREVRLAVPDHHQFGDIDARLEGSLDRLRRDVLASGGDEQVLLPIRDPQEAVVVEGPDVAGVEPAVHDRFVRRRLVAEVPLHHVVAAAEDLAVVGDLDVHAPNGNPHRAEPEAVPAVHGDDRRGFGQSVALDHDPARGQEELGDVAGKRRPAGDEELHPPAHPGVELAEDQFGREAVLEFQTRRHRGAVLAMLAHLVPGGERPVEDLLLQGAAGGRRLEDPVPHLLVEPGHARHHRGVDLPDVLDQRVHALGDRDRDPGVRIQVVRHHAGEHVAVRQHGDRAVVGREGQRLVGGERVLQQVRLGEHHPLRVSGGSRGIDDGGDVVTGNRGRKALGRPGVRRTRTLPGLRHRGPRLISRTRRRSVEREDHLDALQGVANLGNLGLLFRGGSDHHPRARVPDDVGGLLRGQRGIDRHRHGAQDLESRFDGEPLQPVLRQEHHPVSLPHAAQRKAYRRVPRGVEPARGRELLPLASLLVEDGVVLVVPLTGGGKKLVQGLRFHRHTSGR